MSTVVSSAPSAPSESSAPPSELQVTPTTSLAAEILPPPSEFAAQRPIARRLHAKTEHVRETIEHGPIKINALHGTLRTARLFRM
jgi:hypothetical protein